MSIQKDIIEAEFRTSGANQVHAEIGKFSANIKKLADENNRLKTARAQLEAQGKKDTDAYRNLTKQIQQNNAQLTVNKSKLKELNGQLKLSEMSHGQLQKRASSLRRELNGMSRELNPKEWKRLNTELKQTQAQMDKVRAGTSKTSGVLSGIKTLLPAIGFAAAARAIWGFAKEMFNMITVFEQWEKKAKIVFGPAMEDVTKAAEENAKSVGLTVRQYENAASGLADLLVPLKFTRKEAAGMSVDLVNLSGALDEWSGGMYGADEISRRLAKGILGETESLKELGIVIDQSSKEFTKRKKALMEDQNLTEEQAKALDIYNQILEKSTDAQAGFNDGVKSLLEQRKSFRQFWDTIKEGAANFFSSIGREISYIPDNIKMLFNGLKRVANDVLGTSFDVKPVTDFTAAIIYSNKEYSKYADTIDKFGLESERGAEAMEQLREAMEKNLGQEGLEIYQFFYDEQKKLSDARIKQAEEEEKAILEERKKGSVDITKVLQELNTAREKLHKDELLSLKQKRADNLISQEEYNNRALEAEIAHLLLRKEMLLQFKQDVSDVENEIADIRIELLNKITEAEKKHYQQLEQDQEKHIQEMLEEDIALWDEQLRLISEDQLAKQKAWEDEKNRLSEKIETMSDFSMSLGQILGDSLSNSEADFRSTLSNIVLLALDALKKHIQLAIAQATAASLASAESVATWGIAGAAKATALTLAIEAAFAVAKNAISRPLQANQAFRGRYDVLGAEDGKLYNNVPYTGKLSTGLVRSPVLVGEEPEVVIDTETTRNIMFNAPDLLGAINAMRVPQRAAGNYQAVDNVPAPHVDNKRVEMLLEANLSMLMDLKTEGVSVSYTKLEKAQSKVSSIYRNISR